MLALFLSLTSATSERARKTIAEAGVTVMATVSIVSAAALLVYATLLSRTLAKVGTMSNNTVARRMTAVACVISASFLVESVFWLLSIFDQADYTKSSAEYTALFLGFDCASFLAMLWLFKGGVDRLRPESDTVVDRWRTESNASRSNGGEGASVHPTRFRDAFHVHRQARNQRREQQQASAH